MYGIITLFTLFFAVIQFEYIISVQMVKMADN